MDGRLLAFRELEKIYGSIFTTQLIKHALKFISQRIEEEPTEDIKTLDELAEYLLSKTDKYPLPNCAAYYAEINTKQVVRPNWSYVPSK